MEKVTRFYESPEVEIIETEIVSGICATSTTTFEDGGTIDQEWN